MGTRATLDILDCENKVIVTVYRQYDGYPEGMGKELQDLLKDSLLTGGGIGAGQASPAYFNGMECLAPWIIGKLKEHIGNIYLYSASAACEEFFHYTVYSPNDKDIWLKLEIGGEIAQDAKLDAKWLVGIKNLE